MKALIAAVFRFLANPAPPQVLFGLKFGLAGVLAVFVALYLRLENPTWALFTVFVIMIAQYVGAMSEKSVFRIIGTVTGGVLGYLLTASYQQDPFIFLTLTPLAVGIGTAMFGQSRYPYAFMLCGLTIVVVVGNGMGNPDFSWKWMLVRTEEVIVGIICTLLVQLLLWPRYARVEFLSNTRSAVADLRDALALATPGFLGEGNAAAVDKAAQFPARITALRGLLEFGGRESRYFRQRIDIYSGLVSALSRIAANIATLRESLPPDSLYRDPLSDVISPVHDALIDSLDKLSKAGSTSEERAEVLSRVQSAFDKLEDRLVAIRKDPRATSITAEELTTLNIHLLALVEIREQIEEMHRLIDSLPQFHGDGRRRTPSGFVSPIPPPFWIRAGIKSALAVAVALVLGNWLHPPGGTMLILGSWVFTALNATSPEGQGDRRAFQNAGFWIAITLVLSFLIVAARPLLASYAVMNILIFTWLFVWGYHAYSVHGMSVGMQMGMLFIVGILGLNGQEPISFQAVVGFFFGIAVSLVLASVIQRVLWPSLPQWEIRDRVVEFLGICREIVASGSAALPLWKRTRIALIPGEASQRISVLEPPIYPRDQMEILRSYLQTLQRVGNHLIVSSGKLLPRLPKHVYDETEKRLTVLQKEFDNQLQLHIQGMRSASSFTVPTTSLEAALDQWRQWTMELRNQIFQAGLEPRDIINIVGLAGRYSQAGDDLIEASRQASCLRRELYAGDYSL